MDLDEEKSYNYCDNGTTISEQLITRYCQEIFDEILEWPVTRAGDLAVLPCPGKHSENNATKQCMENGEWYVNPEYNRIWTNYTECWTFYDEESAVVGIRTDYKQLENVEIYQKFFPVLKVVTQIGYSFSLLLLITSLFVFFFIKRLHCPRNKLHMNLFISYIMRGVTYLLKEYLFVEGIALSSDVIYIDGKPEYIKENYFWVCKLLMSARNYFLLANYMLILMENFYLNNLMFLTLSANDRHVLAYCCIGWGLPALLILIWLMMKIHYNDVFCWTLVDEYDNYLIRIPIRIIVIVNFIFFLVILRVLCGKINSMNMQHKRARYRRLMRSTLTLVLLLAIPYAVSEIASFTTNPILEIIWIFCDQVFTAFQGLIVALLYCLLNADVQTEIKQKYKAMYSGKRHSRSRTISNTQQFAIQDDNLDPKTVVYWHKNRNDDNAIYIQTS